MEPKEEEQTLFKVHMYEFLIELKANLGPDHLIEKYELLTDVKVRLGAHHPREIFREQCESTERLLRKQLNGPAENITEKDQHGNTLLHYAAIANSVELVKLVYSRFPDTLNVANKNGTTPLHIAASLEGIDVATELINLGAYVNVRDNKLLTPLLVATIWDSPKVFKILLRETACVNEIDEEKNTVLHLAAASSKIGVLEILFNSDDEECYNETIRLLDKTNKYGNTVLHIAVQKGFLECVRILLNSENETGYMEAIKLLDKTNTAGDTVLHIAAKKGFLECLRLLLKASSDISHKTIEGDIEAQESESLLIEKTSSDGKTALHYAVICNRKEIVEILLQEGAYKDKTDNNRRTPLSYAAEDGLVEVTKILLNHDADTFHSDHNKMSPVHYAAEKNHSAYIETFSKELIWNGKDELGRNCLDIAIDRRNFETASVLVRSEKWDSLLRNQTEGYQSPMRKLILHMPDVAREVLNRCTKPKGVAAEFKVTFTYQFLDDTLLLDKWKSYSPGFPEDEPYTKDSCRIKKNHPLWIMATNQRTELLDHPLISALLKKKWTVALLFYLLNLIIYVLFLGMLTGFAIDLAPYHYNISTNEANVSCEDNAVHGHIPHFAPEAKYLILFLAAIELIVEVFEIKLMFSWKVWIYVMDKENVTTWITCICSILFVINISDCTGYRTQWQWAWGTVSVFLAWINLLLRIQKFDWIGIYVVMLFRIGIVFLKFFILVFSFLIFAFTLTFHCLLRHQVKSQTLWVRTPTIPPLSTQEFSTLKLSFFKTTEMMTGSLDLNGIFIDGEVRYSGHSYTFYYLFMIFMTIVVVNVMIGLAVENIREFLTEADFTKKQMQIQFVLEVERLSTSWLFSKVSSIVRCYQNGNDDSAKNTSSFRSKGPQMKQTLYPNKRNFVQRKIDEFWKLTEKDIKIALCSETGVCSELKKEIGTIKTDMQEEMSCMESKVMAQLATIKTDMQTEMRNEISNMESKFINQVATIKTDMQEELSNEMGNMESKVMIQVASIKTDIQKEMNTMESQVGMFKSVIQENIRSMESNLTTIIQNLKMEYNANEYNANVVNANEDNANVVNANEDNTNEVNKNEDNANEDNRQTETDN